MKTLFKNRYKTYHHKAIKDINQWLQNNCVQIEANHFMDGIGYYKNYTVFLLQNGGYCIVLSLDKNHYLRQKIVQLSEKQVENISVHKWLQDKINIQ